MDELEPYLQHGSTFLHTAEELRGRMKGVRALLFDWDGVFNSGFKDIDGGSPFSEVDSMGVNLLRFSLWLQGEALPVAGIITGQQNPFSEKFAQRERMHAVYMGFTNKTEAFDSFLRKHRLRPEQVAFMFDDVLDLPVAERCGLRILMGHTSTHAFQRNCVERGLADVIVPQGGGRHGLREACELLMILNGNWKEVVEHRMRYSAHYQRYLLNRQAVPLEVVRNAR